VAGIELKNRNKTENSTKKGENKKINNKKRRALSTRERGQPKHRQPGLSNPECVSWWFLAVEDKIEDQHKRKIYI
jgi:hypothetical protein